MSSAIRTTMSAAVACLCLAASIPPLHAENAASTAKSITIPAGELDTALELLVRQTGIQLLYDLKQIEGLRTRGVKDARSPQAAVSELLKGTTLTTKTDASGAILIAPPAPSSAASAGSPALRLASGDPLSAQDPKPAGAETPTQTAPAEAAETNRSEAEMIVTGTNIRGVENKTTPAFSIGRDEIDRSGYASTQQLIQSLPQNFTGGQNGASEAGPYGNGSMRTFNISRASGVNLRGLGTTSTLTLIDGQRVASAIQGTAVDISLIPLSAIERVDVLPDGASAVYGSDAIGGVVNFVLRRDFDGMETRLRYGSTTEGSTGETMLAQLFGKSWSSGSAFLSAQYHARDALTTADREFSQTALRPNDLLPDTDNKSVVANLRQELGGRTEIFGSGFFTRKNSVSDVSSSFNQSLRESDTDMYGVSSGLRYTLGGSWSLEAAGSYSHEADQTNEYYFRGPPPGGYVQGQPLIDNKFTVWSADLKASGTLLELPGGPLSMGMGVSHRDERATYASHVTFGVNLGFSRDVSAGFAELYLPLIGQSNATRFARDFAISVAARYDDYSDFGGSTNPRFGVYWSPSETLSLRGSYSTSFRAPAATEQFTSGFGSSILTYPFANPNGPGVVSVFLLTGGGNVLQSETADNISLGMDWTPRGIEGLLLSLNFYDIDFKDRIVAPPLDAAALLHPEIYGSLITPIASDAAAQAYLQAQLARGATFFMFPGTSVTGVRNVYSTRIQNASSVRQRGMDLRASYSFSAGEDRYLADFNVAYLDQLDTSFAPGSVAADLLDTFSNPLQYRLRGGLTWSRGVTDLTGTINYSGNYADTTVVPRRPVSSLTTVDVNLRWSPPRIAGLTTTLSIVNLFDADPPRTGSITAGVFFDAANASPLGRVASLEVRKQW
jgi:iron complex outermembrane receptor protein